MKPEDALDEAAGIASEALVSQAREQIRAQRERGELPPDDLELANQLREMLREVPHFLMECTPELRMKFLSLAVDRLLELSELADIMERIELLVDDELAEVKALFPKAAQLLRDAVMETPE